MRICKRKHHKYPFLQLKVVNLWGITASEENSPTKAFYLFFFIPLLVRLAGVFAKIINNSCPSCTQVTEFFGRREREDKTAKDSSKQLPTASLEAKSPRQF